MIGRDLSSKKRHIRLYLIEIMAACDHSTGLLKINLLFTERIFRWHAQLTDRPDLEPGRRPLELEGANQLCICAYRNAACLVDDLLSQLLRIISIQDANVILLLGVKTFAIR